METILLYSSSFTDPPFSPNIMTTTAKSCLHQIPQREKEETDERKKIKLDVNATEGIGGKLY